MILSRKDLREYLVADKIALGRKKSHPSPGDLIWKFEICMRYYEYYKNCPVMLGGG